MTLMSLRSIADSADRCQSVRPPAGHVRTYLSFPDNWDDLTPEERGQVTLEMADIFIAELVSTPNSPDDMDMQPPEPPEGR